MPYLAAAVDAAAVLGFRGICFSIPSTGTTDMITEDITAIVTVEAAMADTGADGPAVTADFPTAAEASAVIAEASAAAADTAAEDSPAAEEAADK